MKSIILLSALLLLGNLRGHSQSTEKTSAVQTAIFPKGDKAPSENFTGTVWVKSLVPDDETYNCVVGSVTFEASARSNWHTHPAGQILLITDGTGYYQERGKPIQLIHKGDIVKCLPNTEHWHGASPQSIMTHISIIPNSEKGIAVWLKRVTDQQYNDLK